MAVFSGRQLQLADNVCAHHQIDRVIYKTAVCIYPERTAKIRTGDLYANIRATLLT